MIREKKEENKYISMFVKNKTNNNMRKKRSRLTEK